MPLTIPPFVAYQSTLVPIAGRWNKAPIEGDKFIACEIDWGITVPIGQAVQFALNAGPVEFSQIVAFSVDNGRCGGSASFLFPDTGKQLTVPSNAQGVYPVFTNSLTFYVLGENVLAGDITVFEILNSMPPPVSVLPSQLQSHASITGLSLTTNGVGVVIPAGISGTLQNFTLIVSGGSTTAGVCDFQLVDGTGSALYHQTITVPAGYVSQSVPVTGLQARFVNGINAVVTLSSGITAGNVSINAYYSVP